MTLATAFERVSLPLATLFGDDHARLRAVREARPDRRHTGRYSHSANVVDSRLRLT